jgi:restriction system protein
VQVKRWRNKVGAEQIREFAGALGLGEFAKGVYVTTSTYTKGAQYEADRAKSSRLGIPIELIDGPGFYDRLRLKRRNLYSDPLDSEAPWQLLIRQPEKIPNLCKIEHPY